MSATTAVGPLGGLAVFSRDALSSVAYGPEEAVRLLALTCAAGRGVGAPASARQLPPRVQRLWPQWEAKIPLVVLHSPYRNMAGPLIEYVEKVKQEEGYDNITVILPEFVVNRWWESLLHNHSALWLQFPLRNVPGVAVLNMRYRP